MRRDIHVSFLILVSALALTMAASTSQAITLDGQSEEDTLVIHGWEARQSSVSQISGGTASAIVESNCVPIEETGQLRCYLAWTDGNVTAVTIDPGDAGPTTAEVAAAAVTELRRLPLRSGGIEVQPNRGWTLVNLETIVRTSPAVQTFNTTILGIPIVVRAHAVRYFWDFGDGSAPLITTDPGRPWPEQTVTHSYRSVARHTITLRTEWSGEFQVTGSTTWQAINGTATTVEQAPPLDVRAAENSLVTS